MFEIMPDKKQRKKLHLNNPKKNKRKNNGFLIDTLRNDCKSKGKNKC
jgi:hypothetical protein